MTLILAFFKIYMQFYVFRFSPFLLLHSNFLEILFHTFHYTKASNCFSKKKFQLFPYQNFAQLKDL